MKTAATVLRETAEWLDLHGITKGEWGSIDEDGKLCRACVMGAMRYFCGLAPEWEYAFVNDEEDHPGEWEVMTEAYNALRKQLGFPGGLHGVDCVLDWSDSHATPEEERFTSATVLTALQEAAAKLEVAES